ncbi:MAG TPA: FecR family protein [Elusimicrobiota bacterium]|nr:FecR family protein [Elusimicrobiota bacterium]
MSLACLALLASLSAPPAAAAAAAPPARLAYADGDVTIQSKDGGRLGRTGAALADGEAVVTGPGATAIVETADGSRLKLRESSRLVLNLPAVRRPETEVELSWGGVFAKVTKRRLGEQFRVRTQTAVAAVRGTQFFTAYGRDAGKTKDLWVCVNEGAVDVKTDGAKEGLLVPAGKGVLVKAGTELTQPQAYDWTKLLNWNMDAKTGGVEDRTDLESAYTELIDQDYR